MTTPSFGRTKPRNANAPSPEPRMHPTPKRECTKPRNVDATNPESRMHQAPNLECKKTESGMHQGPKRGCTLGRIVDGEIYVFLDTILHRFFRQYSKNKGNGLDFWTRFREFFGHGLGRILDALLADLRAEHSQFFGQGFGIFLDAFRQNPGRVSERFGIAPSPDFELQMGRLGDCAAGAQLIAPSPPCTLRRRANHFDTRPRRDCGQSRPGAWARLHRGAVLVQPCFDFLRRPGEDGQPTLGTRASGFEFCIVKKGFWLLC